MAGTATGEKREETGELEVLRITLYFFVRNAMFFVRSLNIPVHSGFNTARHAHVYSAACRRRAGTTVRFYCKLRLYEPEVFIRR